MVPAKLFNLLDTLKSSGVNRCFPPAAMEPVFAKLFAREHRYTDSS
jgi:hypothetical protein